MPYDFILHSVYFTVLFGLETNCSSYSPIMPMLRDFITRYQDHLPRLVIWLKLHCI